MLSALWLSTQCDQLLKPFELPWPGDLNTASRKETDDEETHGFQGKQNFIMNTMRKRKSDYQLSG